MPVSAHTKSVALSIVAGLLGGMVSHLVSPGLAGAQANAQLQPPPAAISKELRAQEFVLVNGRGDTAGILGFGADGAPALTLFDPSGHVIWSSMSRAYPVVR